ncbi:MAG: hypothetical protein V3R86_06650, partial [Candidatus Hydrothermarchaeaceae archaeon]
LVGYPTFATQNITTVLSGVNYTSVYTYINGSWHWSTKFFNPLTTMAIDRGYWINMNSPDTLELNGTVPSLTTIDVNVLDGAGWNLVGYPTFATQNITTVLSGVNYTSVYTYINGSWHWSTKFFNPLTEMTTGQGYWIRVNEAGSFIV